MKLSYKCDLRWADLDGASNTRRHCQRCDHAVYNLSGMTREQAQRVIELHEGKRVCVHYVTRDGRIRHDGDPLQQLERQRKGAGKLLAAALVVHAVFTAIAEHPADYMDPFSSLASSVIEEAQERWEKDEAEVMGVVF